MAEFGGGQRRVLQPAKYARPTLHSISNFHRDRRSGLEDDVYARSELDEAHALTPRHHVVDVRREHDAPGQQSGNLLEDDAVAFALYGHDILLILLCRDCAHRISKLAAPIFHVFDDTTNWRAIHMYIEDA